MPSTITRRRFLNQCSRAGAAIAAGTVATRMMPAIEPLQRAGAPRLLLSLAAYSFRDYFRDSNHQQAGGKDKPIDLFQFIDFCASQGCLGTELTSYYFPPNITDEFLLKVKRHAFLRGIAISGTAVGNDFTLPPGDKRNQQMVAVKQWVDRAQVLGAPHIRVFAGSAREQAKSEAMKFAIAALQEACDYAGTKGIMLGLENHGGIVAEADDLLSIVQAVKSPWLGINLDTGNFQTDDPYADLARCAPYAVNVQVKTEVHPRGQAKVNADLARVIKILRDANYQGYVALEYEAAEDPWSAVPRILAELAKLMA